MKTNNSNLPVLRAVMIGWLAGWYIKIFFLAKYLAYTDFYPIANAMFPMLFTDPFISRFFYYLPALCILSLIHPTVNKIRLASVVMIASSFVMTLHINTYNDATFLTSFWVAVWLCWAAGNGENESAAFRLHARMLAMGIIAMIFWGGFAGKLTPEYINGDVLLNIHFRYNEHWPFAWIKNSLSVEQIRFAAVILSRLIIFTECMIVLICLFMPFRISSVVIIVVSLSIALFNTWRILSVTGCLIGLAAGCLLWDQYERKKTFA